MYDERIHVACLLTETSDAISALLGGAEFELKQRLVLCADNAEVVGHVVRVRKGTGRRGSNFEGSGLLP